MQAGYFAAGSFLLFTGTGAVAQVVKLIRRTADWRAGRIERQHVCDGLHPVREFWSYSAFLFFALSGLTRSYTDYFLIASRTPIILLSTVILGFLVYHREAGAKKFFLLTLIGDSILFAFFALIIAGYSLTFSSLVLMVDSALAGISIFLFYGKLLQASNMWRENRTRAVSWTREIGLVFKDITGLWYAFSIGSALFFVGLTHVLSALSSSTICWVKWKKERSS